MSDFEKCLQQHERSLELLSSAAHGALLSAGHSELHGQMVALMVRGASAEFTAESLGNQLETIAAQLAGLEGAKQSLNDLSETESLRLQMSMDRLSKLMELLSNILKKISNTANAITKNLK